MNFRRREVGKQRVPGVGRVITPVADSGIRWLAVQLVSPNLQTDFSRFCQFVDMGSAIRCSSRVRLAWSSAVAGWR